MPNEIGGQDTDADHIGLRGNVSVDPQFVSRVAGSRDLRLMESSPVIDAGENSAASSARVYSCLGA